MKKAAVFLTVLALLVQPALAGSQGAFAEGGGNTFLPVIVAPSKPSTGVWDSTQIAAIAAITNNAGKVTPKAQDTNTVENEKTTDTTYEYNIEKHHVVDNIDSVYYLGLNDDIIYPGSLVRGDTAHDFLYTPILIPRAPIWISVNLEAVDCAGNLAKLVNDPNLHNMRNGIRELLQTARLNCPTIPAAVNFSFQRVYNESHLSLFVGANVKYGAGSLDTKFNWSDTNKKTKMIAKYQQVYYSVDITTPASPAAFFDPTRTNVVDIAKSLTPGSKPLYVAGIKYGMMALMFIESSYSEQTMNFALNAAYNGGLAEVDTETKLSTQDIMTNSSISIVVYGGSTAGLGELETGLPGFMKVIQASMNAGPNSPGVPLVYKFRHLNDNTLALITLTSDYSIKTQLPLRPLLRLTFLKAKATMVDDEGLDNTIEMDRFFVLATGYNRKTFGESPGTPVQYGGPQQFVAYYDPGWVSMDTGDEWPSFSSGLQGAYKLDIQYNNEYPYVPAAPGDWDFAYLKLEASARDYDTGSADEWGYGLTELRTGPDILACTAKNPCIFEIVSSDFKMNIYFYVELLNP